MLRPSMGTISLQFDDDPPPISISLRRRSRAARMTTVTPGPTSMAFDASSVTFEEAAETTMSPATAILPPTQRPQAGGAAEDHAHMNPGNAKVGLYLVTGEGVVLISWLILFTSLVCWSQYRKYHLAKTRYQAAIVALSASRTVAAAAAGLGNENDATDSISPISPNVTVSQTTTKQQFPHSVPVILKELVTDTQPVGQMSAALNSRSGPGPPPPPPPLPGRPMIITPSSAASSLVARPVATNEMIMQATQQPLLGKAQSSNVAPRPKLETIATTSLTAANYNVQATRRRGGFAASCPEDDHSGDVFDQTIPVSASSQLVQSESISEVWQSRPSPKPQQRVERREEQDTNELLYLVRQSPPVPRREPKVVRISPEKISSASCQCPHHNESSPTAWLQWQDESSRVESYGHSTPTRLPPAVSTADPPATSSSVHRSPQNSVVRIQIPSGSPPRSATSAEQPLHQRHYRPHHHHHHVTAQQPLPSPSLRRQPEFTPEALSPVDRSGMPALRMSPSPLLPPRYPQQQSPRR